MARQLEPSPRASSKTVSKSMKANAAKNTKPELAVRKILREMGFSGYRLHWRKAPGRPDIAFPGRKLAIFVNGCFWHRCPFCKPSTPKENAAFWQKKFALNVERDSRKQRELSGSGWTSVVIWECEVANHIPVVVDRLKQALTRRPDQDTTVADIKHEILRDA